MRAQFTRRIRTLFALLSLSLAFSGCATNPVTGKKNFVLLSEADEIALGKQTDPQIRRQYGVYDNAALQAYVQSVGERVATKSHRPELVYRFTVLDSPQVNAFALPGGYIYITRGILAYLSSEAELAAVLGHEIGHVTARHSVRQYTAATAAGIVATVFGGGQAGQQLLGVIGQAILSGYGRDHEIESDRLGAQYLARAGYEPNAMLSVLEVLKNQEEAEKARAKAEGREPRVYHGVFASHPSADERLQEVVAEARKLKASETYTGGEAFLKQLDGLVFGDGAREGVRRGSDFYHAGFDIKVSFPTGWRPENTPQAVNAYAADKTALMQMGVDDLNKRQTPEEYLRSKLKGELRKQGPLNGSAFPSYSAIARLAGPFGTRDTRVSAVFQGTRAFVFFGAAKDDDALDRFDDAFLAAAASLRPLRPEERRIAEGLRIKLIKARAGDTFAKLAQRSPLGSDAQLTLRLINDRYPTGEPRPGEMIKIVE